MNKIKINNLASIPEKYIRSILRKVPGVFLNEFKRKHIKESDYKAINKNLGKMPEKISSFEPGRGRRVCGRLRMCLNLNIL